MYYLQRTREFDRWLRRLRDMRAKARILARLRSAEHGNLGDAQPVGSGISELRIHHGSGYRVYYKRVGKVVLLILCGGNKSTQDKDILKARSLVTKYEDTDDD
ncbi:MAG: type II toxin-antitoxin system RelE/ParE family toxin [Pseudohongiellaceae bacterium]